MKRTILGFLAFALFAAQPVWAADSGAVANKFEGVWLREDGLQVRFVQGGVEFRNDGDKLIWSKESCDTGALEKYEFGFTTSKLSDMVEANIPVEREGWKLAAKIPTFRSDCEESQVFWLATTDGKIVYLSLYEGMYDSFVYVKQKL